MGLVVADMEWEKVETEVNEVTQAVRGQVMQVRLLGFIPHITGSPLERSNLIE